jgi:transcriptional regulator with XRE-family HTH domain
MAFGKEIKRIKETHKYSAKKMADILGVDVERLRKWMQKDSDPRDGDVAKIEENTGFELSQFSEIERLPVLGIPNSSSTFKRTSKVAMENQIELLAISRTILSVLAEIQTPLKKGSSPIQLASIYRKMVKDEAELIRVELKQKS